MLAIFAMNNVITSLLLVNASSVADKMICYYAVTETVLNLLSTCFMMVYLVFMWPTIWIIDRYGLRPSLLCASAAMAVGASLRVAGSGILINCQ